MIIREDIKQWKRFQTTSSYSTNNPSKYKGMTTLNPSHQTLSNPCVSVIIPVYNGAKHIERCLDGIMASSYTHFEVIVVDDCSTDNTVILARQKGVAVYQLPERSGPAAARNFGAAHAQGEILLFLDSDVEARRETIASVVEDFRQNPEIAAVFGSYDDAPSEKNFLSQYRNLFHHFHHQQSNTKAFSFWAGCGAIKKIVFIELEGFDQKRYNSPAIEDIELGYRICGKGYQIILDMQLQVKHLKRWHFVQMISADIFSRAIPWSQLILESGRIPGDLNLKLHHKVSSALTALLIIMIPLAILECSLFHSVGGQLPGGVVLCLVVGILYLNRNLYAFFAKKRGAVFMVRAIPLHIFYYLYSGVTFVSCWGVRRFSLRSVLHCGIKAS